MALDFSQIIPALPGLADGMALTLKLLLPLAHGRRGTSGRDQQPHVAARLPLRQQLGQGGWFVAEQRDGDFVCPDAVAGAPSGAVECGLARQQVWLTQQAARALGEAGVVEPARQARPRAAHERRRQPVAAFHIGLGRQVLQVDP